MKGKYNGLQNQGGTCYLNSVLQVLFMTKDFRERIKSNINFENHGKKESIDKELRDLFKNLENDDAYTHKITNKLKIQNVYEHRDAAEHYEKILRLTSPEASAIFHGELVNRNKCQKCLNITENPAGFWHLPLPLVDNNSDYSVEKGIEAFFRPSLISGDDQMYCEKCDEKCDAVLDCEVKHYPDVLVLLLKRFELIFDGKSLRKVKLICPVKMPDTLHMPQNQIYKLYAYVEHFGELQYGHYIAKIKSQDDDKWYIFDDLKVNESSYNHFQLDPTETFEDVYLLFYRKQRATSAEKYNGLINQGATCYLNSVLQVLFMTEDFREKIKSNKAKKEHIDGELKELFEDLEERNAYTFKITKKLNIKNVNEQRDAAEHYEKILRLTSKEASQSFHGELVNRNKCQKCLNITESPAGFWHLPLPLLDNNNEYSVEQGIEDYFRPSEISGDDQMYCEKCDEKCDAVLVSNNDIIIIVRHAIDPCFWQDCEVRHHPEVLVLLLKRFEFDYRYMMYVKINQPVNVPKSIKISGNQSYNLYGFVEHFGELRHGHYISTIKSQDDDKWYKFDDSSVTPLSALPSLERSRSAHLLFYQKQKDENKPDKVPRKRPGSFDETAEKKKSKSEKSKDDHDLDLDFDSSSSGRQMCDSDVAGISKESNEDDKSLIETELGNHTQKELNEHVKNDQESKPESQSVSQKTDLFIEERPGCTGELLRREDSGGDGIKDRFEFSPGPHDKYEYSFEEMEEGSIKSQNAQGQTSLCETSDGEIYGKCESGLLGQTKPNKKKCDRSENSGRKPLVKAQYSIEDESDDKFSNGCENIQTQAQKSDQDESKEGCIATPGTEQKSAQFSKSAESGCEHNEGCEGIGKMSSEDEAEKNFDPLDRTMTLVNGKDDLDPFSRVDGVLKARLSCGHVVTAESLTDACRVQLDEGNYKFKCTAMVEGGLCNSVLPYREVRKLADLSVEEMQYFEENIARLAAAAYCDVQICPKCKTNIKRKDMTNLCVKCSVCSADQGEPYFICWQCLKKWKGRGPRSDRCDNSGCKNYELELLQTCKLTSLPEVRGADAVPSIRACPTCGQRVEHDKTGCKNVICPRCQIEFCFVCLKLTPECLETSTYFIECSAGVAPRQTSIPVWRRT
ncbi:hypothetical protein WMY93_014310 [Mugilogobius chulae]|uniref:USP domain-containing protein n=1 Tax=Mugilogobius chulae TaxID=88201 RepID=A0AAW0P440_9GOBI